MAESPLYPKAKYVGELRSSLPPDAFEPARSRVAMIPAHVAIIVAGTLAIACGWLPWPLVPAVSIAIGISFGCLTFVAHEALHGGVCQYMLFSGLVYGPRSVRIAFPLQHSQGLENHSMTKALRC